MQRVLETRSARENERHTPPQSMNDRLGHSTQVHKNRQQTDVWRLTTTYFNDLNVDTCANNIAKGVRDEKCKGKRTTPAHKSMIHKMQHSTQVHKNRRQTDVWRLTTTYFNALNVDTCANNNAKGVRDEKCKGKRKTHASTVNE
jgi:isopenicillin N synthase-like dioxygenase